MDNLNVDFDSLLGGLGSAGGSSTHAQGTGSTQADDFDNFFGGMGAGGSGGGAGADPGAIFVPVDTQHGGDGGWGDGASAAGGVGKMGSPGMQQWVSFPSFFPV